MMTETNSPLPAFQKIPWLALLDQTALAALARATTLQAFGAGQIVFMAGDQPPALYLIRRGWLKAVKLSPEGREQILDFRGPGQPVNFAPVFAEQPSPATLIALEDCEMWAIPRHMLLDLLDHNPQMARAVIRAMAKRLLYTVSLIEDLSLRSVTGRLAKLLVIQADQSDSPVIQRRRWATQAEIAARLGTVPDVAHRALRSLADEGLIEVSRSQIVILDRASLLAKAQV